MLPFNLEPKPIELRPYQTEALEAIKRSSSNRQLVSLPTGTGKTVIFAELLRQRSHQRSLVLVHRDELVRQTVAKCADVGLSVGVIKADRDDASAPVVVASVQTLSRDKRLVHYLRYGAPATVIVDEAHHAPAPTYRKILGATPSALVVGFTATPDRSTKATFTTKSGRPMETLTGGMGSVWEQLVYYRSLTDMIAEGWLSDVVPGVVRTNMNLRDVPQSGGDFTSSDLGEALEEAHVEVPIVDAWLQAANGRPTIAFFPTVKTSQLAANQFNEQGISAQHVDADTSTEVRQLIYTSLRDGTTSVITNCMVLTEGFDEPCVSCIIVGRPTRSRSLFAQMIGRGTRLYPNKLDCVVLSVVSHDLDISPVTLQTFLDDPGWPNQQPLALRKRQVAEDMEAEIEAKAEAIRFRQAFVQSTKAKYLWYNVRGMWTMRTSSGSIRVSPLADGRYATSIITDRESRLLCHDLPLDGAIAQAERWASEHGQDRLANPEASWRGELPTPKQRAFARKLGIHVDGLSRGEVSDLIDRALRREG